MSIINEALKKTQINLNNLRGSPTAVADDRAGAGQKTWRPPVTPLSQPIRQTPSSAPAAGPAPQNKRTSRKRWYLIVAAEILTLGLAAWVLFIFQPQLFRSSLHPKKSPAVRKSIPVTAQLTPATSTAQPAPAVNAPFPPREPLAEIKFPIGAPAKNLILNGIMMDQNKMVALINGEIYEVGDYIGDQRVNKITLGMVELREGDNVTILEVRE